MDTATGFEEFVSIVDEGSVSGAATALGLPRPTLSKRLARLEERLGVRLLHRTTRRMTLTPQGRVLYAKARRLVEAAREVEAEVRRLDDVPRGLLRINLPDSTPHPTIATWIDAFLGQHPEVSLEVVASTGHLDLVRDGFDVALRRGPVDDASLIAKRLAVDETLAVATPTYLERAGTPQTEASLQDHACIVGHVGGINPELTWPRLGDTPLPVTGRLRANQMELRLEAVRRHLGIAMISRALLGDALESGALVHVLPDVLGERLRVNLLYADREFLEPKVRAFVDFFVEQVTARRNA